MPPLNPCAGASFAYVRKLVALRESNPQQVRRNMGKPSNLHSAMCHVDRTADKTMDLLNKELNSGTVFRRSTKL